MKTKIISLSISLILLCSLLINVNRIHGLYISNELEKRDIIFMSGKSANSHSVYFISKDHTVYNYDNKKIVEAKDMNGAVKIEEIYNNEEILALFDDGSVYLYKTGNRKKVNLNHKASDIICGLDFYVIILENGEAYLSYDKDSELYLQADTKLKDCVVVKFGGNNTFLCFLDEKGQIFLYDKKDFVSDKKELHLDTLNCNVINNVTNIFSLTYGVGVINLENGSQYLFGFLPTDELFDNFEYDKNYSMLLPYENKYQLLKKATGTTGTMVYITEENEVNILHYHGKYYKENFSIPMDYEVFYNNRLGTLLVGANGKIIYRADK